jgi:YebC/PmpR family DNA-binding regulatory protein
MAGHSQFKNIMHRKGAQDAKRAKVFTKLIRELTVAAKQGGDPSTTARLRAAVIAARVANMPKDTQDRAIARGMGAGDADNFEEIRYEGYGPGGVAVVVEALTDNRNRTAPEVRSSFTKYGGNLGETNSVSFQFDHVALIEYPFASVTTDRLLEIALEGGADDIQQEGDVHQVFCQIPDFHKVREELSKHLGDPLSAKIIWQPLNFITADEQTASSVLKLLEVLEDNDDVQAVFSNVDIPLEILEKLSG